MTGVQTCALPISYFTRGERSGELINTASEGIEALDAYYSQYLPQLVLAALVPISFLTFIFPLDWISGLVLLLTAPLIPLFMILIGNLAQALTRRQWQALSRMSAYFLDVLQGLTALKTLGRSRAQGQVIEQVSDHYRQVTMSVLRVTFLSALALEMISTLSTAVVAVEIGLRLLYGRLSFEQGFFVLLLAPEFYLPIRLLGTRFHAGMSGVAAARRIFEVLNSIQLQRPLQPVPGLERVSQSTSLDVWPLQTMSAPAFTISPAWEEHGVTDQPLWVSSPAIRFVDVHVTHDDHRHALAGVSFEIPSGYRVALVGPSGSGKSTVASLLLRFIEPGHGDILVDDRQLASFSPAAWREWVAWVPQSPYLFRNTIAANIRLARPRANMDEVIQAAIAANAHEFILDLPEGYHTQIGERGVRLSGGQIQRIALARAFLKESPLLILDEATANLDPESEEHIRLAIDRLLVGRTTLLIAHRLATVYQAHQIIVLEKGRVVESGSHQALLQRGGLYSHLVSAYMGTGV